MMVPLLIIAAMCYMQGIIQQTKNVRLTYSPNNVDVIFKFLVCITLSKRKYAFPTHWLVINKQCTIG